MVTYCRAEKAWALQKTGLTFRRRVFFDAVQLGAATVGTTPASICGQAAGMTSCFSATAATPLLCWLQCRWDSRAGVLLCRYGRFGWRCRGAVWYGFWGGLLVQIAARRLAARPCYRILYVFVIRFVLSIRLQFSLSGP